MNLMRKRKLILIVFILSVLFVAAFLVMYALRQNISLFYSPTQLAEADISGKMVRLGGMVVDKSVYRDPKSLIVEFKLTDYKREVTVIFRGILPDLFREGQGIVALGKVIDAQHFMATEVLAKHDANYMPSEVKAMLVKKGDSQT